MKLADFKKMKLMMNMTLSGSDQEKLTAIAKVNEIIARSNTTWDKILDRVIKVDVTVESVEDAMRDRPGGGDANAARALFRKRVDAAFATIEESDPRGSWADFVADLKEQWERNGRLSEKQVEAILQGAKNVENRR
jgi:hypothetical protein